MANMEKDIESAGGVADVSLGRKSRTTLEIERTGDEIDLSIWGESSVGEMLLGVKMGSNDAREVADQLRTLAAELDADVE